MPADSAEMYCLDGVYTRMGAGDDLAADMSTFMVSKVFYTTSKYVIVYQVCFAALRASAKSCLLESEEGRRCVLHICRNGS